VWFIELLLKISRLIQAFLIVNYETCDCTRLVAANTFLANTNNNTIKLAKKLNNFALLLPFPFLDQVQIGQINSLFQFYFKAPF
jgi:hypothetical protein